MFRSNRREFFAQSAAALAAAPAPAQPAPASRNILTRAMTPERLAAVLLPREAWRPYGNWDAVPADAREALVRAGERSLRTDWPALPATLALEFQRNGNRSHYEAVRNTRREKLRDLTVAECVEGRGRFLDDIVNGIWTTCEETFWGVPAHLGAQKAGVGLPDAAEPIIDLFAAETSAQMAWTLYLLGPALDRVSPLVTRRIRYEVNRRLLAPGLDRDDFGWMGLGPHPHELNNWTPWIVSNWLTSALAVESDEARRRAAVYKCLRCLDNFLNGYHDDGGCDEGPSYWNVAGGALFDCLELLRSATGGALDVYGVPLIQEIGRYIYRVHIAGRYYIDFADASAKMNIAGDMVFRYGRRIGDARMAELGAWAAAGADITHSGSLGRQLAAIFDLETIRQAPRSESLVRDAWLPGIQVMAARRREGSAQGLYLAAQGGHNAESHNHNDVGNFIVYAGGQPVIIDAGVGTYTAQTFSAHRYEIWTMQSAYHNLPTIGGVMQKEGRQYAASDVEYRAGERAAEFALEIAHAYPAEAGLRTWRRTLRLDRERNRVEVRDRYALEKPARDITLTLMTAVRPDTAAPGRLSLAPGVTIAYDARVFQPAIEEIQIDDARLHASWGDRLYRVLLKAENPPREAEWLTTISEGGL